MFKVIKTPEQIAAETSQREKDARVAELRKLLADSDYKAMPDYDKPNEEILAQRQQWRDEIRTLSS